jgi:hypothetical protein
MSKERPRLAGGLIVRKGEAVPSAQATPQATETKPSAAQARADHNPPPKGLAGTIAVTVRLDPNRYERMKIHGARQRRTNQQILVAALDAYLADLPTAAETRQTMGRKT